jgi:imidazole glycerol-phosphate synthase subunit HisH
MITIIDYGIGNVGSIENMLRKIGVQAEVTSDLKLIAQAEKLILPGVGHFDFGMQKLQEYQLIDTLNQRVLQDGVPILGICLGMQLFTKSSEEGTQKGLGWVDAETKKFVIPAGERLRVPHMGWNTLSKVTEPTLFADLDLDDARFYFVHSYYIKCNLISQEAAKTNYSIEFDAAFRNNNIFGVQFHPEKSHKYGMKVLGNFAKYQG